MIPARYALPTALASLYVIWGSTYLAIVIAVRTLPPLLMAGLRFMVAGALLLTILRLCGQPLPDRRQWLGATLIGALLLLGGNGTVCLVADAIPSGIIALVIACTTLCVVLVSWLAGGPRPTARLASAIACGLLGVGMLVYRSEQVWPVWDMVALFGACVSWAVGTIASKQVPQIPSPWIATGAQMLAGGLAIILVASVRGEWAAVQPQAITQESLFAWGYLVIFGSICGFGSYVWLLRHASPALATSYGYVNPVVALGLGAWLNGEELGLQTLVAGLVIVGSVALIASAPAHDQR